MLAFYPTIQPGEYAPPRPTLADAIDPWTGDYSSLEGADPTDAAVLDALRIVRGSGASVQQDGQQFTEAQKVTEGLSRFLREEVEFALRRLIATQQITLLEVTVTTENDSATIVVRYRNEAQREDRSAQLGLPPGLGGGL